MVIFSGGTTGNRMLVFGLSHANVQRLMNHEPILCSRKSHGMAMPADLTVSIFVGETEASIYEWALKAGLIDETTVKDQKRPV